MTNTEALDIITRTYLTVRNIPEEEWISNAFSDIDTHKCCFVGHYTRLNSHDVSDYRSSNCCINSLTDRINEAFTMSFGNMYQAITSINDGCSSRYTQATPKQRTMAACHDAMQILCDKIKAETKPTTI